MKGYRAFNLKGQIQEVVTLTRCQFFVVVVVTRHGRSLSFSFFFKSDFFRRSHRRFWFGDSGVKARVTAVFGLLAITGCCRSPVPSHSAHRRSISQCHGAET